MKSHPNDATAQTGSAQVDETVHTDLDTFVSPFELCHTTAPPADVVRQWDQLVDRVDGSDVTQLSAWARVRALAGYSSEYLLVLRDGQVVGGALLLRRRVFGLLDIAYLPYGPVIDPEAREPDRVRLTLVNALTRLAHQLAIMFIQPPEGANQITDDLLARGFRPSDAGIAPTGSYRLDLTRPLDAIRSGFSKRLKYWTNRWEAKGVRVRQGGDSDIPLIHELMAHTGARHGFRPPTLNYIRELYRQLAKDGHAAIFVGEVHGKPVSADLVTIVGGMVRGRLGGFDSSGESGKLSVPAAARWEIIKWAKQRGLRWLDFGGLPERMLTDMIDRGYRTSDEWPSSQRAKLAFNGEPFRYPTPVELIRPKALRVAYDALRTNEHGAKVLDSAKQALRGQFRAGQA